MMSTLTRNVMMVCSLAVLCAVLVGCSSNDDKSAELERQLDMEKAARMTAEQERDDAQAAQMDARVALAAADKIQDAASYGAQKVNRDGDIIVVRKLGSWDDPDAGVTGWLRHFQLEGSGSDYTVMSQSYRDGGWGMAVPWYGEDGELEVVAGTSLAHRPWQRNPDAWPFRGLYTPALDRDVPGVTSVYGPIENHGLGADWQGVEFIKTYEGGGTLTFRFFTDLAEADSPGNPYAGNPPGDDANYPNVVLNDIAIPVGWDNTWVLVPEEGLPGSLDGVTGTFSCAPGENGYCGIENGRHFLAPGFTPDVSIDPVIFTPDDGSAAQELPAPQPTEVPVVNYLSFGDWLFVPEDITDLDAYDFGVFAGGDDPFTVDNLQGLAGTADYAGEAAGTYADVPAATINSFNAQVELTADFGMTSDFGTIEGRVYEFEIDGRETSPLTELGLYTASWREGGTTNIHQSSVGGDPLPGGWVEGSAYAGTDTATWVGVWGGKFFGNGTAATDLPTAFAGTFGATDGDHSFAGSFGASQQ